jgi:DNA gyrase subunit A
MGRATQGVKLINLKGKDSIAAVTVMKDDVAEVVMKMETSLKQKQ